MILVDQDIKDGVESGEIGISDFSESCLQPASYDLRVGEEAYTVSKNKIIYLQKEKAVEILPGDFALIMTHEKLSFPTNMVGRFGLRSIYARKGLLLTGGPQIDPGFEGKLIFGVVNFSSQSIDLPYLELFCTLELHKLDKHAKNPYKGPYKGQEHITDVVINEMPNEPFPLAVMLIQQLAATSPILKSRKKVVSKLKSPKKSSSAFQKEKQAFEKLKPELMKKYRGKYVVIKDEKAEIFDDNKTKIAEKAYKKFGYVPIYIGLLEEEPETVHFPTPRVQGE